MDNKPINLKAEAIARIFEAAALNRMSDRVIEAAINALDKEHEHSPQWVPAAERVQSLKDKLFKDDDLTGAD